MENKIFDIIIIGAGPAGMTAAIYAGRAGKKVAIVDKNGFGGNIANSPKVENIPGFASISGADFAANMYDQMSNYSNVEHIISELKFVDYKNGLYKAYIDDTFICGLSMIIATGAKHKELKFDTKDIYYCVTCDGPMFKNKNVVVVGSGNTGATYALELANYCKNVYLVDITRDMRCENTLSTRINSTKNITWKPNTTIKAVKNNKEHNLTSITTTTGEEIKCSAIFGAIGLIPQTDAVKNIVSLNSYGYICTNDCNTATIPGLFAAGDCRDGIIKQVTTACADGTISAINACKFIDSLNV